jgi:PAS domain S-box-containing protein
MNGAGLTNEQRLVQEIEALRIQLEEAQELIKAIRTGEVDALAVQTPGGPRIFTLQGADHIYRTLIEEMNEGAVTLDNDATILYSNASFARLLSIPLQEVIGSSFYNFVPPDFIDFFKELLETGWKGRSKGEIPLQSKSGIYVPFSLSMSILSSDEIPALGVIITNLSAQREICLIKGLVDIQNAIIDEKNEALKKQEDVRREAEQMRQILESIPQMAWMTLPDGYGIYYNQRWYQTLGADFDQCEGWKWTQFLHPEDVEPTTEIWLYSLETGQSYSMEYRFRCQPQGQYRWMLVRGNPLKDAKGEITHWVGTCTDIQEQKEIEQAKAYLLEEVREQRRTLYHLFAQMPAAINVMKGPDLVFELANDTYQSLMGKVNLIGKPLSVAFPEIDPGLLEIHQMVLSTGKRYIGESFPINIDPNENDSGQLRYFDFVLEPLHDENGQIEGLISFGYEVTDQVLARQIMEKNAAKVGLILDSMPQIAWTADITGINTFLNRKWYEYIGASSEDKSRAVILRYLHRDDIMRTFQKWKHSLNTGEKFEIEYRIRRKDGMYRWMLARALPLRNDKGRVIEWVGTATDIHDQKVMLEELALAKKQLSEKNEELNRINVDLDNFVYTASHDLKSPVATLEGFLMLLSKRLSGRLDEKEQKMMEMVQASTGKLLKTIRDLTEITKVQKDIGAPREKIVFAEILEEVKPDMQALITESGAKIQTSFEAPTIQYARKNLRSIVYNLLNNALKYRSQHREPLIRINTHRENGAVVLSFSDNGLGFKPEQLQKLFTMFKRFHDHVEGSGIGLYMIKRIVENNGGQIEVESQEGEGTTFRVVFREETMNEAIKR